MTVRLQGEWLQKEIVYQATVTISEKKETYVGLTATAFKQEGANTKCNYSTKKSVMTLRQASSCEN